jgi:predicted nucleotidyltransferase
MLARGLRRPAGQAGPVSADPAVVALARRMLDGLRAPEGSGVLLVGSHARRTATEASDLDLLVLPPPGAEAGSVRVDGHGRPDFAFRNTLFERHLVLTPEVELDVEVVPADVVERLAGVVRGVDALRAGGVDEVATLQPLETRLLVRLAGGLPLAGPGRVRDVRERLRTDALPNLLMLDHYVSALACLEDALVPVPPGSGSHAARLVRALAARAADEHLVLAALAYHGTLPGGLLAVPACLAQLERAGVALPGWVADAWALLLAPDPRPPERVYERAVELFRHFDEGGLMPGCVGYLRRFGRGRWRFDLSFLADR